MVLEAWIQKMGNNVSGNMNKKKKMKKKKRTAQLSGSSSGIGILSFEVARVMSKAVQIWQSLSQPEVQRLRNEVVKSEGVVYLVSEDEGYLLGLACAEKMEDLDKVAGAVSRLGKKCEEPALQGFEHIYSDLQSGSVDFRDLELLIRDMDAKVKKMESYIGATASLYQELEVLTDLEHSARKLQGNLSASLGNGGLIAFQRKILWQRQEIKHLRDVSLWNKSFDKVIGLLARTVCTIYGRICSVFGYSEVLGSLPVQVRSHFPPQLYHAEEVVNGFSGVIGETCRSGNQIRQTHCYASGPLERQTVEGDNAILGKVGSRKVVFQGRDAGVKTESSGASPIWSSNPGRMFKECLNLNGSYSSKHHISHVEYGGPVMASNSKLEECFSDIVVETRNSDASSRSGNGLQCVSPGFQSRNLVPPSGPLVYSGSSCFKKQHTGSQFGAKHKLVHAPPSTLGGAALALHYANVIILVEKLVRFPHLVGHDARDDLYHMLPTSVRSALRSRLKSCVKNLTSTMYDASLAGDWKDALERILGWLAPLAHNMIRWQSEHNFEQQQVVSRTSVLLLQTLYFADQVKAEAAITELLVGLNYICRYEQEIRANGLFDCRSSQDYDEYLEWHL